jgi:WD40 repeat protein
VVFLGSQDGSVKVWCISNGYLMTTVEDLGEDIGAIQCCDDDKRIVVSSKRGLTVLDFDTGEILQRFVHISLHSRFRNVL